VAELGEAFEVAWARASAAHQASASLDGLVSGVCLELRRRPPDPITLRKVLEDLLVFLASSAGRSDENCRAVDSFFCIPEVYGWEVDWTHLPAPFQELLSDIGGILHDTVSAPEIARNFESTPEQLLERVRRINV
jgi:hypothetical protein